MDFAVKELLPLIPLFPLMGACINGVIGHRLPRWMVSLVACGTVLASFAVGAILTASLMAEPGAISAKDPVVYAVYRWIEVGGLQLNLGFVLDHLSGVMVLVVTGVGFLIHVYSIGYMSHDPSYARYFAYLNLFTFAMLVLVLGDSMPVLFIGWEGVGLCSYLLIGFWFTDSEKAAAGKKAFVVNRIGDFGFIVAMLLLFRTTGALDFEGLQQAAAAHVIPTAVATGACLMLILGAAGKSAQLPLHIWLPDAMAGPTPVSALIHAATMVTAGVYLSARMGFMFELAPIAMLTMAFIGALTALFAATIGTAQNDIKKVLAYSTVSQLGFMFIAAGVGAYAVAIFHLVTHAFFKACLFLGSGSVIHGMSNEQDMRQMGGLWRKMPITFVTFFIATLAITGFPFLAGFISKDAILWNAFAAGSGKYGPVFENTAMILWGLGVIAAGFTSFYMWRLVFMTFFSGELRAAEDVRAHVHESPLTMTIPLMVLAFLSLVGGVLGWPHLFGGHDSIAGWLAPVVGKGPVAEGAHVVTELALMGASVGIALMGFLLAWVLYAKRIHPYTTRFASQRPWRSLYVRVANKWDVDEIYDLTVVRPLGWISRVILNEGIDKRVIDGSVNGVGWLVKNVGFVGQLFQGGNIQRYLAIFAIGLCILLYGWVGGWSSAPDTSAGGARAARHSPRAPIAQAVRADSPAKEGGDR